MCLHPSYALDLLIGITSKRLIGIAPAFAVCMVHFLPNMFPGKVRAEFCINEFETGSGPQEAGV